MTTFEIIDAKPWHVGQILRQMRDEHRQAIQHLGINAAVDLRRVFAASSYRKAWLVDGKLAALGGAMGTLASSDAHIWLVMGKRAEGYGVDVVREARKQLKILKQVHPHLTTTIFQGDETGRKFALYLGFRQSVFGTIDGLIRMSWAPDKPVVQPVSRTRDASPFIVFGLPRSRTAWLAKFLSYGKWSCVHDAMMEVDGFSGMRNLLSTENIGICETGFAFSAPLLKRYFPKTRFAVIRRPIEDVRASLAKHDWNFEPGHLEWMDRQLDIVSQIPGTLTLAYDDLSNEESCRKLFEFCLGETLPQEWYEHWSGQNIQLDMSARLRRLAERSWPMERLVAECQELMSPVTFQIERWDRFFRDGTALFAEHRAEVGSFQGLPFDLNVERAEMLDATNHLQITTARAGTKMVGYLVFVVDDYLEDKGTLSAVQNTFFVAPSFRGLGPRLHAESVRALKERGISILSMSAGVRGSGPKLASLYKRLGAIEERRVFSLRIA